jgi:hypothetical protein
MLQIVRRKKWDPERMKVANEVMKNEEMGSYKASTVVTLPQTTLQGYVKDRQKGSSEAMKQNWVGSKFFLVKLKMFWLSAVLRCKESCWA